MPAAVKVSWRRGEEGWTAALLTSGPEGLTRHPLPPGADLAVEFCDERRCIGAFTGEGLDHCPTYTAIDTGSQCAVCRRNDVYADYVIGRGEAAVDAAFSVYLAQCGRAVKVGVTRSERLPERWIEQGADYAAEIETDLTSAEALEREQMLAENGIPDLIRKEEKLQREGERLSAMLSDYGYAAEVVSLADRVAYPALSARNLVRTGRLVGTVRAVKGQIIETDRACLAVGSGRVVREPVQQGLEAF